MIANLSLYIGTPMIIILLTLAPFLAISCFSSFLCRACSLLFLNTCIDHYKEHSMPACNELAQAEQLYTDSLGETVTSLSKYYRLLSTLLSLGLGVISVTTFHSKLTGFDYNARPETRGGSRCIATHMETCYHKIVRACFLCRPGCAVMACEWVRETSVILRRQVTLRAVGTAV